MRDAKMTQIYEGTNQIQRLVIAREMLQGEPARSCSRRVVQARRAQRRPRPLPGGRDHEGRPLRLLRRGRAGDRAAPARPAVHDEALARGARRAAASSRSRRRRGCPAWIPTRQFPTWPREGGARLVDFPLVNSREALLWMVQMHCIDMNAWYSRVDKPERPDFVALRPRPARGPTASRSPIAVAHLIREALEELDLRSYVKTSGADGIHVLVPIARRSSFDETYEFAELLVAPARGRAPRRRDDRVAEEEARAACSSTTARTATARRSRPSTRCARSRARRSRRRFAGTS